MARAARATATRPVGAAAENKVAKIGVIAPLSGDLSALGKGIQHSVELAVKQATTPRPFPDGPSRSRPVDDEAKPDVGKNGATKLAGDDDGRRRRRQPQLQRDQQTQPVFATAKIAQISPANTGPTLTHGRRADDCTERQYPSYFRTCTTDLVQGKFAAKFLVDQEITKVATIHDKKTYGQGLVAASRRDFEEMGGQIVAAETITEDDANYAPPSRRSSRRTRRPSTSAGSTRRLGPLSQQMKAAGLNVPLMGGDGIFDPTFIELAAATSQGDFATSVGGPDRQLGGRQEVPGRLRGRRLR